MSSQQSIDQTLAALKRMTARQLKDKYLEVFGEASRSGNKDSSSNASPGASKRTHGADFPNAPNAVRLRSPTTTIFGFVRRRTS